MRKRCEWREEPQGLRRRESPGDEYTFSLVSALCPQGPCSGLDSEARTPYRRTSTYSSPVASSAQQSGAEGQSWGSGWDRVVTVPPRTVIRLQSAAWLPGAATSLPGLHRPPVEGSATAASAPGLCTLQLSQSPHVLPESCIGLTTSWTSKGGWAKASARSPCGHHALPTLFIVV